MKHGNLKLAALADIAIDAIRTLVSDPNTPPAIRLRAAKLILDSTTGPSDDSPDDNPATAQQAPNTAPERPGPVAAPTSKLRPLSRVGRDDYCPCASGLKFKKCCLRKMEPGGPLARDAPPAAAP